MFGLFSKKVLVYTALGHEDYFKVVGRLQAAGIKYKTKSRQGNRDMPGQNYMRDNNYIPFDIYVKKEDRHKAQKAIHESW